MAVVSEATLRQDIFSKIFTLINANLPTYTGKDSTTRTYTLVSAFPDVISPAYPLIVLTPAEVNVTLLHHDATAPDYKIEMRMDFYCLFEDGKKGIDAGRDSIMNTILNDISSLKDDDGLLLQEKPFEDTSVDQLEINRRMVHTGTTILRMIKQ